MARTKPCHFCQNCVIPGLLRSEGTIVCHNGQNYGIPGRMPCPEKQTLPKVPRSWHFWVTCARNRIWPVWYKSWHIWEAQMRRNRSLVRNGQNCGVPGWLRCTDTKFCQNGQMSKIWRSWLVEVFRKTHFANVVKNMAFLHD